MNIVLLWNRGGSRGWSIASKRRWTAPMQSGRIPISKRSLSDIVPMEFLYVGLTSAQCMCALRDAAINIFIEIFKVLIIFSYSQHDWKIRDIPWEHTFVAKNICTLGNYDQRRLWKSALLILLINFLFYFLEKSNLSLNNNNLKWGEISSWNIFFSQMHVGHNYWHP